jgi:hypothetical protein
MIPYGSIYLSKSRYIKGLQCQKSLYLHAFQSELRDKITERQQAVFDSGTDVGVLARSLFPGGVEIPYDGLSLSEQLRATADAISREAPILYEAAFNADGVFIKADILRKVNEGWEIYEVKSSTSMKDLYLQDVGVQCHVLKASGLTVSRAFVVLINNQYVRQGELDIQALFNIREVTDEIHKIENEISETILKLKRMLRGPCPEMDVGRHCQDPYTCDFIGHCWAGIPEDSVLYLKGKGAYNLYGQGFRSIRDVPLTALSEAQQMQVMGSLEKKDFVNEQNIRSFLETLHYPLCFLDFETIMPAIPPFNGVRPYQQIPFQFSLQIQEGEGAESIPYEYLADPSEDYREDLLRHLLALIPENACILAYNMSFEKRCLNDLAAWFPQYRDRIEKWVGSFRDLMAPFRSGDIYLHRMQGSCSLKDVLPAMIPEMTYEDLEIQQGDMASVIFLKLARIRDDKEKNRLRQALLAYCERDTLAMVRILEKMKSIVF